MVAKKAEALPPLTATLLPVEKGDVLGPDELWSSVGSKTNARWVWIALRRQTRQVVAYSVGDRSADAAPTLRERIPPAPRCRATRNDFLFGRGSLPVVFPGSYQATVIEKLPMPVYRTPWKRSLRHSIRR